MSFASETLAERITRLMGKELRNPEKTRELLAKLSHAARATPQPCEPVSFPTAELRQSTMFEETP